ncbi:MAG: acyl-CoA dehydrogenase family protein [Acidimicrobiales bacterium]
MLLQPDRDQESFRDTTGRFLDRHVPAGEVRRLRDDPAGFDLAYWRQGAELGWTSLLVDEAHGGGSISDRGLVDLTLVADAFGRRAAPGPLIPANLVAHALSAAGHDTTGGVLDDLLSGAGVATWALSERQPGAAMGSPSLQVWSDGAEVVLRGEKRPVESADRADHLLVTGRTDDGLTQVLVPRDSAGVSVAPMRTVDLTRRFSVVTFDDVRVPASAVVGALGQARAQVEQQARIAIVLACAESVGAMQAGFDLTVAWAFDRYSLGRPLASYQALKHRFADMLSWLEASHAVSDEAAVAVADGSSDAPELASAAKAYVGLHGTELLQDCVQLHGGIGVTFEHDLHLYLRRHTLNRVLYGSPREHHQRLTDLLEAREAAA